MRKRYARFGGGPTEKYRPCGRQLAGGLPYFVVLHEDRAVIAQAQQAAATWLADLGLEMKPSKTRVTHTRHTLQPHDGAAGFDFLGFHLRQYPAGKTHTAHGGNQQAPPVRLGCCTRITPSAAAIQRHTQALHTRLTHHQTAPQAAVIHRLKPVIRGGTRYDATVASARTFARLSRVLSLQLRRWTKRRHPNKSADGVVHRDWRLDTGHGDVATTDGVRLFVHTRTHRRRYVKVQGTRSPFDGDWAYGASRLGTHPERSTRIATLLQRQQGKCAWCGRYCRSDDLPELAHIVPTHLGGIEAYFNWQLLHRHCHDAKTALDGTAGTGGTAAVRGLEANHHSIEEPDEAKVSRPVLEAGGRE